MPNFLNYIKFTFLDKNKVLIVDDTNNASASNVTLDDIEKTKQLKTDGLGNKYLSDNGTYQSPANSGLPIGSMVAWGGERSKIPEFYLPCEGQLLTRASYQELFAIIGTTYGAGDGTTTFNLPDTRGRVIVHPDTNVSVFATLGKKGGHIDTQQHTHVQQSHTHTFTGTAHTHTLNSHTHTVPIHSHSLNSHTHTSAAHTHSFSGTTNTTGNHNHGVGSRDPSAHLSPAGTGIGSEFLGSYTYTSFDTNYNGNHSHTISGTTGSTTPGSTGAAAGSTGNSTELSTSANNGNTSSTTATGSNNSITAINNNYGTGDAGNLQPYITAFCIMKVL